MKGTRLTQRVAFPALIFISFTAVIILPEGPRPVKFYRT
jgi:hypothetical protein